MVLPDEVLHHLQQREEAQARRWRAVAALPAALRAAGWQLLGYAADGKPPAAPRQPGAPSPQWLGAQALEALPPAERHAVFAALYPAVARHVAGAWELQKRLPYGTHGTRRAFRAPGHPALTLARRSQWLQNLLFVTGEPAQGVTALAERAGSLGYWASALGLLFAAAIDGGDAEGDELFAQLTATLRGEHERGAMGRHVVQGLLCAARPAGWTLVERTLLAAQREEGLRQVILETADEAHPEAFRRLVHLIREENLVRFSSVVRAVDVWLGLGWDVSGGSAVRRAIAALDDLLADEPTREAALRGDDPERAYFALCATAFADVDVAVVRATPLLARDDVAARFAAAYFLSQAQVLPAQVALLPALHDDDLRVATVALRGVGPPPHAATADGPPDLFERLEAALSRFPQQVRHLEPLLWPWIDLAVGQEDVVSKMIFALGERPVHRLLPYINLMDPGQRQLVVTWLSARTDTWDEDTRALLLRLLGDRSSYVREQVIQALATMKLTTEEAEQIEAYLQRKAGDLRRGVITLLLQQDDDAALTSGARLLAAGNTQQRQAGLELLRQMMGDERLPRRCRALLRAYEADAGTLPVAEAHLLGAILDDAGDAPTLEDGLGLYDPAARTAPLVPTRQVSRLRRSPFASEAAVRLVTALDALIHEQRETPVTLPGPGDREELLGNLRHGFPHLRYRLARDEMARLNVDIPLRALWLQWWQERPAAWRDADGLELLRALAPFLGAAGYWPYAGNVKMPAWMAQVQKTMFIPLDAGQLRYRFIVHGVLTWLLWEQPPPHAVSFLLDAVAHTLALVKPDRLVTAAAGRDAFDWRQRPDWLGWLELARLHRNFHPKAWAGAQHVRLWRLLRWLDEPGPELPRLRPPIDDVMLAYHAGGATEADIYDQLIGPRPRPSLAWFGHSQFLDLNRLSGVHPDTRYSRFAADPPLPALVARCRHRIVTVELQRGDMTTPASVPALALRYSGGASTLVDLLQALGRRSLSRGWTHDNRSKQSVLSHLIRATRPGTADTPALFARLVQDAGIRQERLIAVAMYAPQWASHVAEALGWPAFAAAVWWFHAHTKDTNWHVGQEVRDLWAAEVNERTPLTGSELMDGAVDVAWFHRVYDALGAARWAALDAAAKYASGGGGHRRAQLFAQAMSGALDEDALRQRIDNKRHQDSVRALGLLPLPAGPEREEVLLTRYLALQAFAAGSRKFGSQRRASEGLATRIGLENLARTAGYPDPLHLQWAMEARAAADLAAGPLVVTVENVTVTLAVDDLGEAHLRVEKEGRRLKAVPARLKKEPALAALLARKRELAQQVSRARRSLEQVMCRGNRFTAEQVRDLLQHPVLRPMLEQLLFIGEDGGSIGYPVAAGRALQDTTGAATSLAPAASLRLAHPHDLFARGDWHAWQQDCFRRERIQPFKQVFRELYPLTRAEADAGTYSARYEGQQVNPRQALALLGSRGWVVHPEEGIRHTFHDEGLSAWLTTAQGIFTPAEVEAMTLAHVTFTRRGEWQPQPLTGVPPRLFSEVMRDLDLVVSVAHAGGVDPEATASTVEMRATLVRETCALLNLENVRLTRQHVLIQGHYGDYNVHLGSGTVHRQPGGAVCIIPVHGQHRGRLFLPFVDDDPKTAEVVSKVLLLARDRAIKDPTILEQIVPVPR